ncbi:hypothetical protein BJ742DRAFT_866812, partial [Cladochytrium replicatum]
MGRYIVVRLASIHFLWGQILLDQRRFDECIHHLDKASRLHKIYKDGSQLRIALAFYALGDDTKAQEMLSCLMERTRNADLLVLRAKLYKINDQIDYANVDTQRVVKLKPDHPEIAGLLGTITAAATEHKNNAWHQLMKGDHVAAVTFLNSAIELDPRDSVSLVNRLFRSFSKISLLLSHWCIQRGTLFVKLGQPENALADFQAALEISERDTVSDKLIYEQIAGVYNHLGVLCCKNGDIFAGVENFSAALYYDSDDKIILRNRADAFLASQSYEEAMNDFLQILSIDGDDVEVHEQCALLLNQQGQLRISEGSFMEAASLFEDAINHAPNNSEYRFNRANALYMAGKIMEAREELERVLSLDDTHPLANALRSQLISGPDVIPPFPAQDKRVNQTKSSYPKGRGSQIQEFVAEGMSIAPKYNAQELECPRIRVEATKSTLSESSDSDDHDTAPKLQEVTGGSTENDQMAPLTVWESDDLEGDPCVSNDVQQSY